MENVQGRVAVVAGAASGIGLALSERFGVEGMKVVLAVGPRHGDLHHCIARGPLRQSRPSRFLTTRVR